jgi:sulfur-oxidizing protein SoxY
MIINMKRREWLVCTAVVAALPASARDWTPALQAAVHGFTGGASWREGRVTLEVAPLVENGNAVPVTVRVQSAMSATEYVRAIAIFTERNPQPEVVVFQLGAEAGRAEVSTRMRLATTQNVWAMARLADGSCWAHQLEVIVTLASCVESD